MVRFRSGGGGPQDPDEATPIMHPVRMELAPHARLGRRMHAATAIAVLLVFHVSMLVIGVLNWDMPCDGANPSKLALFLVIYASIGLLFVYLLFREWMYYARLSTLPSYTNLVLLILFFILLCVAGGFLIYEVVSMRNICQVSAPLLYRWAVAAAFFFAILAALFLVVPLVRVVGRCLCAPVALCMIGCVETVGVDVEYTELAESRLGGGQDGYGDGNGYGDGDGHGDGGGGGGGRGRDAGAGGGNDGDGDGTGDGPYGSGTGGGGGGDPNGYGALGGPADGYKGRPYGAGGGGGPYGASGRPGKGGGGPNGPGSGRGGPYGNGNGPYGNGNGPNASGRWPSLGEGYRAMGLLPPKNDAHMGGARDPSRAQASSIGLAILALPLAIILLPLYYIGKPIVRGLGRYCCEPFFACCGGACAPLLQSLGVVEIDEDDGKVKFVNPVSDTKVGLCCGTCLQLIMAPGCIVPGRSLVALFVNTAALLWFFLFMGFELWSSWEVMCPSHDPGTTFQDDWWGWLYAGAPSPIHWLLLIFVISGLALTILGFVFDLFSGPAPPPRSHYEAAMWRGRRQAKVISITVLIILFVAWGILLAYFTFDDAQCNANIPRLYNIALLLVLLLAVLVCLGLFLGCCVLLDCCISGRMKFVLLLRDQPEFKYEAPDEEQFKAGHDATLIPGNPSRREGRISARQPYGTPDDEMAESRLQPERSSRATYTASGERGMPQIHIDS